MYLPVDVPRGEFKITYALETLEGKIVKKTKYVKEGNKWKDWVKQAIAGGEGWVSDVYNSYVYKDMMDEEMKLSTNDDIVVWELESEEQVRLEQGKFTITTTTKAIRNEQRVSNAHPNFLQPLASLVSLRSSRFVRRRC
jgi:hypothetical protein